MIVYPQIPQYSPEWWSLRRGRPTASKAKNIVTASDGRYSKSADGYMYDLIADCFNTDIEPGFDGRFETFWMRRGTEMEPLARIELSKILGCEIHQVGFCIEADGLFGCSPDGLIAHDGVYVEGAEFKVPEPGTHVSYVADGGLPSEYIQQVHCSMAITNLKRWHFLSHCPGMQPFHIVTEWNEYTEKVKGCMAKFSQEYKELREALIPKLQLTLPAPQTSQPE